MDKKTAMAIETQVNELAKTLQPKLCETQDCVLGPVLINMQARVMCKNCGQFKLEMPKQHILRVV